MGKGDKKTKKGKIAMGSYGVTRPRPVSKNTASDSDGKKADGAKKSASKKGTKA
ncbi:30S ribosomal protein THX [Fulvivirga ulvae]|uniref:30S ribosomal protein THX n=1 Tax=Fulvivirga ulvae TaxID=2904245 RepID=UPI001F440B7D|nr:30S ribosomal protein THX [Fulvivirga ulvae]UII30325.1 30S ribosomal protein THX [Fulvivirga ulvae]